MICWNRFISYIYRYHNYEKCENTGFAKVQKISGRGRVQIGLKDIVERRDATYLVYIYRETLAGSVADHENHPVGLEMEEAVIPKLQLLGKLSMKGGRGETSFAFDWDNVMGSGKPMTAWNGILIRPDDQGNSGYIEHQDLFCSSWTDSRVDYARAFEGNDPEEDADHMQEDVRQDMSNHRDADHTRLNDSDAGHERSRALDTEHGILNDSDAGHEKSSAPDAGYDEIDSMSVESVQEVSDMENKQVEVALEIAEEVASANPAEDLAENPAEEILATREKLPLLPAYDSINGMDAEIFECVKITPNDIGLLDMENWRLGVNSFLTHGFYHYQYLMFGRVVFREEETSRSYILGVPGVYSSKEKYLADIFGFDRFVPCQETMVKTGSFGYWIVDIKS